MPEIPKDQRGQQYTGSNANTISQVMTIDEPPVLFDIIHEEYKYTASKKETVSRQLDESQNDRGVNRQVLLLI